MENFPLICLEKKTESKKIISIKSYVENKIRISKFAGTIKIFFNFYY